MARQGGLYPAMDAGSVAGEVPTRTGMGWKVVWMPDGEATELGSAGVPGAAWLALFLGTASVFANMYSTQAILPVLGRVFGVPPATAGLTISVVVLGVAAGSLIAGPLSDRVGRKPVMIGASALLVLPTLLCALAPGFASLLVFRALQGLLMPGLTSVAIAYVNEAFPVRQRGTAMGVYVSGQVLGGLLARGAGAGLTALLDWRHAFIFFTLITAAGALLLAAYLPPSPQGGGAGRGRFFSGMGPHLRNGRLLVLCITGFSLFFAFVGIFTYLPYLLTAAPFHVPVAALGLVYLIWLTGIFSPVAGTLAARYGREQVLLVSLGLACLGIALTLVPSLPVVILGTALQAAGMFMAVPCANLLVGEAVRQARGSAAAIYLCCYYLGGSAGGVVPGVLWERLAWPGVVGICLAMALGALVGCLAMLLSVWFAAIGGAGGRDHAA